MVLSTAKTSTFYIDGKGETPTFDVNELSFPHPSNWTIPLAIFKQKRGMFHFGYQESTLLGQWLN